MHTAHQLQHGRHCWSFRATLARLYFFTRKMIKKVETHISLSPFFLHSFSNAQVSVSQNVF